MISGDDAEGQTMLFQPSDDLLCFRPKGRFQFYGSDEQIVPGHIHKGTALFMTVFPYFRDAVRNLNPLCFHKTVAAHPDFLCADGDSDSVSDFVTGFINFGQS